MRKNTLFVSVLLGFGALGAVYSALNIAPEAKYETRNAEKSVKGEFNDEFLRAMRTNVNTGKVEAADYINAVSESKAIKGKTSNLGLNWDFIGPDNVGGRARAIVVDKDDDQKLYSGGAAGGMYVSSNAGGTWEYKSGNWANIHVSTIAQDGNGRIYAGTGFYSDATAATNNGTAFPGGGIWVSDDRGDSWSLLSSTEPGSAYSPGEQWAYVNKIAVSKNKNSAGNYTVYAATRKGLMVSADNGVTWTKPLTIPNCVNPLPGKVQDVITLSSGRVLVAYNGELYLSDDGETTCSYVNITDGIGGSSRMSLTACGNDENIVYAMQSFSGNPSSFTILKSTDAGMTWAVNAPAPPSSAIDSTFDLLGSNPVEYNQAITVDPTNCNRLYVGAVSLYRIAGSWGNVASNFGQGSPFYVHSDKHQFVFDPHNPKTMYVATDGGIGKTKNADAGLVNWTENNRGMGTTQYYGIGFSKTGQVLGGTQDNGSHFIDPTRAGFYNKDATEVFGGDGYDAEVSNIGDVAFVTSQYGAVGRTIYSNGDRASSIHPAQEGQSPFFTVIRFWESLNDLTSKDSINFVNGTLLRDMGAGDGNKLLFAGTLVPEQPQTIIQPDAAIVPGSIEMDFTGNNVLVTDASTPGVLRSGNDSIGWVDYASGDYEVRFLTAPPAGVNPSANYNVRYAAGSEIVLISKNQNIQFTHQLLSNLETGDSVKVQDPVQSLLALSMNGAARITRDALIPGSSPQWVDITTSTPTSMEWSKDGNHLYVGHYTGTVMRISGFNNWYSDQDNGNLVKTTIYGGNGGVSGMSLHPTDPEKLLITIGGYGNATHVVELGNAQSASSAGAAMPRVIQGDLPDFPVYDPEYNVNNTDQVLIGTELGLWATNDVNAASVVWTNESGDLGNVPVFDVRQQQLPFNEAHNHGVFYLGTFGRGIWTSTDLVSVNDNDDNWGFDSNEELNMVNVYPNPVVNVANIELDLSYDAVVNVSIYTINGTLIKIEKIGATAGKSVHQLKTADLPNGTYFATVQSGESVKKAKFVVLK